MKKKGMKNKTLIICETLTMIMDLKTTLGGFFDTNLELGAESDEYILIYGCPFQVNIGNPEGLKEVYVDLYSEYFERKDVASIVWYTRHLSPADYFDFDKVIERNMGQKMIDLYPYHHDFIDDVMKFREAIGTIRQREYIYFGKRVYALDQELLIDIRWINKPIILGEQNNADA